MPILTLYGCPPEPLGNYLKALGVFRLVAEQADPVARAWWEGGVLHLFTQRNENSIREFFLGKASDTKYSPTPIFAPWGGRPGFYRKGSNEDARSRLLRIIRARKIRKQLCDAASTLVGLDRILHRYRDWDAKNKVEERPWHDAKKAKKDKDALMLKCRNSWPHRAVQWLDACLAFGDKPIFGWLFGTGGNEGSADITNNFWQLVEKCVGFPEPSESSPEWLESALFSKPRSSGLAVSAGQLFPASASGENIGQGFDGASLVNPWDVVLEMEGCVLFAAAVTKRLSQLGRGKGAFPFMIDHIASDTGPESAHDEQKQDARKSKCKAEFWMPLWARPLRLAELCALLAESRIQTPTGSAAEHSTQALEAIASLGVSSGVSAFRRIGLFERRGKGYNVAATIEEVPVPPGRAPGISAVADLAAFRYAASSHLREGAGVPDRILTARHLLEASVARVARRGCLGFPPAPEDLQAILASAADLERECSLTKSVREAVDPCSALSRRWVHVDDPASCLDQSAECQIALAIASLSPWGESIGARGPAVGSLRTNLVPVTQRGDWWQWNDQTRSSVWSKTAPLLTNLANVLNRRIIDSERGKGDGLPLWSFHGALLSDMLSLWQGRIDESRLSNLIGGLSLVDFGTSGSDQIARWQIRNDATPGLAQTAVWFDGDTPRLNIPAVGDLSRKEIAAAFALPRAYALLKLCFVSGRLPAVPIEGGTALRTGNESFPDSPAAILNLLRAGRSAEALLAASRVLREKAYPTIAHDETLRSGEWELPYEDCRRMAGMLLIPVRHAGVLAAICLKPKSN